MTGRASKQKAPRTGGATAAIRALPTRPRPLGAETPEGYLRRPAQANRVEPELLWTHLRSFDRTLPYLIEPEHNPGLLEAAAGLPAGWFAADARRHLVPGKCEHTGWKTAVCESCGTGGGLKPGCIRCTAGAPTDVRSIGGPICLKHRVWCTSERVWPLGRGPAYIRAEHQLRTVLHRRGVGIDTGELQAAQALIASWAYSWPTPARIFARKVNMGGSRVFRGAWTTVDPWLYPETVALATVLTDPDMTALILSPHWEEESRAALTFRAVAHVTGTKLPMATLNAVAQLTTVNSKAMDRAYHLAIERVKSRRGIAPALITAARTRYAPLLRHIDGRTLPRPDADFNFYKPVRIPFQQAPPGLPYRWLPRLEVPFRAW